MVYRFQKVICSYSGYDFCGSVIDTTMVQSKTFPATQVNFSNGLKYLKTQIILSIPGFVLFLLNDIPGFVFKVISDVHKFLYQRLYLALYTLDTKIY